MAKGNIRHMFPGGNTSRGFYSYYEHILTQEDACRIFVIKGGPGTGKSTFMKKIGEEMVERGFNVEHMHCSSDNNSLDGLVVPAIKVALLDGTSPHVVDPKNPGAVDEIIHLGDYWNEEQMVPHKQEIMECNRDIGRQFARAYRYIRAAAALYEDTQTIYSWAMDWGQCNILAHELLEEIFAGKVAAAKPGRQRKLFASAITPDGLKNHLRSILYTSRVIAVSGMPGTGTEQLLEKVCRAAVERGLDIETYYCPLSPEKMEHIVIPGMDISLTTVNEYHNADVEPYSHIDLNEYTDKKLIEKYAGVLLYNKEHFDELLQQAVTTIAKAKKLHDDLEKFYIGNMDFEAVQICWESTLARILELI